MIKIHGIIKCIEKYHLSFYLVLISYVLISLLSLNNCYFWDNIQQTSKEAHWFYCTDFSSLILPDFSENEEIVGTGYHPPLIGIITAFLWKISGKHLWVSHVFIACWSILLIYNIYKLLKLIIPGNIVPYVFLVLSLESTILTQISIASPDIILLTSFVISIRAILEKRLLILSFALLFLFLINGRGTLTGGIIFLFYLTDLFANKKRKITIKLLWIKSLPFLPAIVIVIGYFAYYFSERGWFFGNNDSPWKKGWENPEDIIQIFKNITAYGFRLIENGRFFIWLLGLYVFKNIIDKRNLSDVIKNPNLSFFILFILLFVLFLYFAVSTKIVIVSRYYMGMFLIFTILVFKLLSVYLSQRKIVIISYIAVVLFLSGHLWIYPEKIAKSWDATLAHWPYYSLRKECLSYLQDNNIDFSNVSGGFMFSGNQKFLDLKDNSLFIANKPDNQYFIYSNISNLDNRLIDELKNPGKWQEIKTFKKYFVFVSIYKNSQFYEEDN